MAGTPAAEAHLDHEAARSFPRFAEAAGAVGLSDLLEAAATWASVVRGQEAVSRGELLQLATEALAEPPRREDALRVFGTLLRQGPARARGRGPLPVGQGHALHA